MKKCQRCGQNKSLDEFHKNKRSRDGLANYCKECVKVFSHEKWEKTGRKRYLAKRRGEFLPDARVKLKTDGATLLCKVCGEWKPLSKFPSPKAKDQRPEGYVTQTCRACDAKRWATDRAMALLLKFSSKKEKYMYLALSPRERVTRALGIE